jgi:hypothetical protein
MWYCWILAIFGLLSVFTGYANRVARKNPWNWEHDKAQSDVDKRQAQ